MRVTGIGGFFFRSADPDALTAWYRLHLGVGGPDGTSWQQAAGPTIFAPFAAEGDYFAADKQWMLNLRVDDLDTLTSTLRSAGITVFADPAWDNPETGRFARIHDPEGNPVELWQPPAEASDTIG